MKSILFAGLATLSLFKLTSAACGGAYAQCGGSGFQGSACCQSGYSCVALNQWYSQCKPASTVLNFYTKCNNPKHWAMTYDDGPNLLMLS
eukprot:jgi/Orpsp1_1/1175069/evm.model.c7180000052518.1